MVTLLLSNVFFVAANFVMKHCFIALFFFLCFFLSYEYANKSKHT